MVSFSVFSLFPVPFLPPLEITATVLPGDCHPVNPERGLALAVMAAVSVPRVTKVTTATDVGSELRNEGSCIFPVSDFCPS